MGLLLCKTRNKLVAEYALRDNNKPIGVAEYQLAQVLPADLENQLPSIGEIQCHGWQALNTSMQSGCR
ncbi:PDDEXK nuclease domain-containing protein [Methylotuvimicrobium buryatense]|uniref:PDDEXK nuclease domain-containing protein n=1 Tax=Methylotuvimicrobium buryatense TaxID=95641 RepID=UPI0022871FC0|nr:PDDEXK nuclease domain-containing protein [Methylotuvimicrobium buryatense]